ncbi:MAG TPA: hypothetical protein ENK28_11695 [Aliiroseovarius sp.]|nr:hypothetical protein [Aliiroseovarius sp.]
MAGAGGSGKSGTVIAGILGGLQTVGDDYVHVSVNNGDTLAQPVYTTLKQDPDGLKRLGLSDKEFLPQTVNWQGKYQFNLTDLNPASLTERLQITALVLPKISSRTQSRFRPAQTKEAFLTLAPSGVSQIHGDRDASFALAAKVTRALPCYFMDLSQDPAEISTALRTFIGHQSL